MTTTKKVRKPNRKTIKEKVISYRNKTWEYIMEAYERLKVKYKMKVKLSSIRPQGAGLYFGNFIIA